jgi:hypothetical protein
MKKILILVIPILMSCTAVKLNKSDCNENEKFKEMFFYHIGYIKKNISVSQDSTFIKSVIFLSNYAPISIDRIMNYSKAYPTGVFEKDQIKLLEWYEENKCKNIQFINSYIVPEVYRD